jgi:GT2 family glycosyltransferase
MATVDVGLVVPTLGSGDLAACAAAVASLDPSPGRVVVVASGRAAESVAFPGADLVRHPRRLGFAAAVNCGLDRLGSAGMVALLNDDATPSCGWLGALVAALDSDPGLAAVQGTVTDAVGDRVDGRGVALDRFGLPVQLDRGASAAAEPPGPRPLLAVSGTAALFRREALAAAALPGGAVLDPGFGSYHEDVDLGLRLARLGWRAAWVAAAPCRHLGSATGLGRRFRHPWWLLANRWRALSGNLEASALLRSAPRLLRGELRGVRTLTRGNPWAPLAALAVAAALPWLVVGGLARRTPGPRLEALPGGLE